MAADSGTCSDLKIIENIMISKVFGRWEMMAAPAQAPESFKTSRFRQFWGDVGGDRGPCQNPKIIETTVISLVFGEAESDGALA